MRESDAAEAPPGERAAKRQRLDGGADGGGGLADGEVPRVAAQSPAACYVCRLADVPGKFRPDKVGSGIANSDGPLCLRQLAPVARSGSTICASTADASTCMMLKQVSFWLTGSIQTLENSTMSMHSKVDVFLRTPTGEGAWRDAGPSVRAAAARSGHHDGRGANRPAC